MDSFGGGGFGGGGYMQDGGGFGSPMTDSQEKKVSSLLCFQEIKHTLTVLPYAINTLKCHFFFIWWLITGYSIFALWGISMCNQMLTSEIRE